MTFIEQINQVMDKNRSLVCVGLDTDPHKIPDHLIDATYPVFEFNKAIIDATADLVCAYKPQIAYYAAYGTEDQLKMTIDYIHETCPGISVILDAKRNDIGSTAAMYAKEAFERYASDAVTVTPYLGSDGLTPFLGYKDKGTIILCRTSNPSAVDIQDQVVAHEKLYRIVARLATEKWNRNQNIGLVVGATYPAELKAVREIVGEIPFLVPGIGAQGGDVEQAITNGLDSRQKGMIINSSRGIIYAGSGKDFADAARAETNKLKDQINKYR